MQRLFSTFPSGSPGVGLLLLRMAVAVVLIVHSAACLGDRDQATLGTWAVGALVGLSGGLLLMGFLTPLGGLTAALGAGGLALSVLPSPTRNVFDVDLTAFLVMLAGAAIALIGPGAFSLDAALFGRREITIPPRLDARSGD